MKKLLLLWLITLPFHVTAKDKSDFPEEQQRIAIAKEILSTIEKIDALTIPIRNQTRKLSWQEYKTVAINRAKRAHDWPSFYRALDNIHYGLINKHSYLQVDKDIQRKAGKPKRWPQLNIGYTWPEISFFSLENKKEVTYLDEIKISDVFERYFELYCNDIHKIGCLNSFTQHLKYGYKFLGPNSKLKVTFSDHSHKLFDHTNDIKPQPRSKPNCKSLQAFTKLKPLYIGDQACLFSTANAHILKLNYFGSWGTNNDDIYCKTKTSSGMCFEINKIKGIVNKNPDKKLVIDLQNNGGGSENTPWLIALSHNGFSDNLVAYKNLTMLSDKEIRQAAFYGSERAENWYRALKDDKQSYGTYLPIRSDFCRGSNFCENTAILPTTSTIKYAGLHLVVNEGCVSSCDDLVWRLRQYSSAKTSGQYPATDGAYARLDGHVFLMPDGSVQSKVLGEGIALDVDGATPIVSFRIPISQTVTSAGKLLEGDKSVLDFSLPVTKKNFESIEQDNLKRTLLSLN